MSSFSDIESEYAAIKRRLCNSGQNHLLKFWDELTKEEQLHFLEELRSVDFENVNRLFEKATNSMNEVAEKLDDRMRPVPSDRFESEQNSDPKVLEEYRNLGYHAIADNQVCVLLLAGGQGTRLGVTHPKGMYSVGLPSGKPLFQIQAERIRRVLALAQKNTNKLGKICWYIMTSGPTNEETAKFLADNDYFGLNEKDVILFQQGLLPCFDFDGRIFLDGKGKLALAPDGNGGIYRALDKSGVLSDMEQRGIKYVHVHSVDNILVKVADPVFIGYCSKKDAQCGAKVVSKAGPFEAVGVVCQVDGRYQVVEYSEITEKTATLTDSKGNLVFSAGNICNHFFTTDFLREIATKHENDLKLHVAKKKIPHVNNLGARVKPSEANGIKIEKFVFDAFEFTDHFVTWEVPRISEFSALKNADDAKKDCPLTARRDLLNLHRSYVERAGGNICEGGEVEISPLLSYEGEDLRSKVNGKSFSGKVVLTADYENVSNCTNGLTNGKVNGDCH